MWFRLDLDFADDPKVRALARYGRDARGCRDLFVQMIAYAQRHLTDGVVPDEQIGVLVYPDSPKNGQRDARRLVEVGLVERVEGGWRLVAYLRHQRSKEEVVAWSETRRASSGRANHARWHVRRGVVDPECAECAPKESPPVRLRIEKSSESDPSTESDRNPDVSAQHNTTQKEITTLPTTSRRPRESDPIWDALMGACGITPTEITSSARGAYNAAAKALRDVGATPAEISRRARDYRMRFPNAALTPTALAKQWAALNVPQQREEDLEEWMTR